MQPADFAERHRDAWGRWVLQNGLPVLPPEIALGETIPVSYWRGATCAAVLFVRRFLDAYPDDSGPDDLEDAQELTDLDAERYRRVGDHWEAAGGGGANWHMRSALTRPALASDVFELNGMYGSGGLDGCCVAVYGYLGTDIAMIELVQGDQVEQRTVVAPVGAAVVAADGGSPFVIRALTRDGSLQPEIVATAASLADFWDQ